MKIMVVGSGGREHAVIRSLKRDPRVEQIFALPGNGGIAADATCVDCKATDLPGLMAFAQQEGIDFAVVTPDDPLVLGAVDALEQVGVRCFGPTKAAARIEGSKAFAKDLMQRYDIPTAQYRVFDQLNEAIAYLEQVPLPIVIKADGLALGKGVVIAQSREEGREALRRMMEEQVFGKSGTRVVMEEFLTGPEVSVLAFCDGKTVVPMVSSMDHKRAYDNDEGPNTGGMGTIAPNPYYTKEIADVCMKQIFLPTVQAMAAEGSPFSGCLFFGLMLTPNGPKVIEYNCRFGDPETQVVLPLLQSSLLSVMLAVREGTLAQTSVEFLDQSACCVILASKGYPLQYQTGFSLTLPDEKDVSCFVAGAKRTEAGLVTAGGRVVGVTALAETLDEAIAKAYEGAKQVQFENAYYRTDIGAAAQRAPRGR